MILTEIRKDIFTLDDNEYHLAQCISSDCAMGAGIAVDFERKYHLRSKLLKYSDEERKHPTCIKVGPVFNLITKDKYYNKPNYVTVYRSLNSMKEQAVELGIKKIAMPKIASGLDRLNWAEVKGTINRVFENTDIEILICNKF